MISIKNLTKRYGNKTVLTDLSLDLSTGSIMGLMGKNGAGKTTLINCITGKTTFDGNIRLNDEPIGSFLSHGHNKLHYVPDSPHTYSYLTAIEQIQFAIELKKLPFSKYKDEVHHMLELFDLKESSNELIRSYSFGMRRKVALITALVLKPSILILDEPVLGLDTISIIHFKKVLKENFLGKSTVIYSTHIPELINDMCDSLLILHNKVSFR